MFSIRDTQLPHICSEDHMRVLHVSAYLELLDGEGDARLAFKVIMVQLTRIERGRCLQRPITTKICILFFIYKSVTLFFCSDAD
jgi:hypothetical protein